MRSHLCAGRPLMAYFGPLTAARRSRKRLQSARHFRISPSVPVLRQSLGRIKDAARNAIEYLDRSSKITFDRPPNRTRDLRTRSLGAGGAKSRAEGAEDRGGLVVFRKMSEIEWKELVSLHQPWQRKELLASWTGDDIYSYHQQCHRVSSVGLARSFILSCSVACTAGDMR